MIIIIFSSALLITLSVSADETKIVGGHPISLEEAPHQVSLQYWRSHFCGGSIINTQFVVTAAHCVYPDIDPNFEIRVGTPYLDDDENGTYYSIQCSIIHPRYSPRTHDYDIAVLKVATPFVFDKKVQPITLVKNGLSIKDGVDVDVTGWGNTEEGGYLSSVLMSVTVPVVSNKKCYKAYSGYVKITARMICAGVEEGGLDACQGDSGSGLIYKGQLAGVVSFGFGCARPYYPGVYSRVAAVRKWIDRTVSSNS